MPRESVGSAVRARGAAPKIDEGFLHGILRIGATGREPPRECPDELTVSFYALLHGGLVTGGDATEDGFCHDNLRPLSPQTGWLLLTIFTTTVWLAPLNSNFESLNADRSELRQLRFTRTTDPPRNRSLADIRKSFV